jgi:hypothetical protein
MDSDDLTREQAAYLHNLLGPTTGYLTRLQRRMEQVGFAPADRLYRQVTAAQNAMQSLCSEFHYLSCDPSHVYRNRPQKPNS